MKFKQTKPLLTDQNTVMRYVHIMCLWGRQRVNPCTYY